MSLGHALPRSPTTATEMAKQYSPSEHDRIQRATSPSPFRGVSSPCIWGSSFETAVFCTTTQKPVSGRHMEVVLPVCTLRALPATQASVTVAPPCLLQAPLSCSRGAVP